MVWPSRRVVAERPGVEVHVALLAQPLLFFEKATVMILPRRELVVGAGVGALERLVLGAVLEFGRVPAARLDEPVEFEVLSGGDDVFGVAGDAGVQLIALASQVGDPPATRSRSTSII